MIIKNVGAIIKGYNLLIVFMALSFTTNVFAYKSTLYLDQGWTIEQRQAFYETPQGSYLIPLKWYLSLEPAHNYRLFSHRHNIKKFNYLIKVTTHALASRFHRQVPFE